jgi:hypothetical protein
MMKKTYPVPQNPLILRFHRLMDVFSKSDDERDFYLDKLEGFILFVDLDKGQKELDDLEKELQENADRYCSVVKMTFYETKKFMEGFVNEKIYDIDTKEKLFDIIQSKEARENFIEFIYDHINELEKWQQYYQERMRIRVIEWLRSQQIQFVFEEDLELGKHTLELLKQHLFDVKVSKDLASARDLLFAKAKSYYSSEALNPRPKRGRPPKQIVKIETEPQFTADIYTSVPPEVRPFLYLPEITSASSVVFSSRFDTEDQIRESLRGHVRGKVDSSLEALSLRLQSLTELSGRLSGVYSGEEEESIRAIEGALKKDWIEEPIPTFSKKKTLLDRVKGFLPRKKEAAPPPIEKESPKKSKVRTVTPIQKRGKK